MVELKLVPTGVVIVKIDKVRFIFWLAFCSTLILIFQRSSPSKEGSSVVWTTFMNVINFILWIFNAIQKFVVNLFSTSSRTIADEAGNSSPTDRYV